MQHFHQFRKLRGSAAPASATAPSCKLLEIAALVVWLVAGVAGARAQAAEPSPRQFGKGFITNQRGVIEWVYPERATEEAAELQKEAAKLVRNIEQDLGKSLKGPIEVRVGTNVEQLRSLAPFGAEPPEWAQGAAYPSRGVILLSLTSRARRTNLKELLAHELSHVALHQATGGAPVPRWFTEGIAIYQSGENSLARMQALWGATVGNRLVPLRQLSGQLPGSHREVTEAYAQSADFVRYLRSGDRESRQFRRLIALLEQNRTFHEAVEEAYGMPLASLEAGWRAELAKRYRTYPKVFSAATVFAIASLLLVLAYFRRRKQKLRRLQEWERAEKLAWATAAPQDSEHPDVAPDEEPEARRVLFVSGDPPQGRESGVPTVEHEGRNHTLH